MDYQGYFFDFDHTLFDSDASEASAFDHALTSNGVTVTPDLFAQYKRINSVLWREVEAGVRSPLEVRTLRFAQLVEQIPLNIDAVRLADAFTSGMQSFGELYPGASDVLVELRTRAPVVMVTNAISQIQRGRIERLGVGDLFDAIVISSEVGVAKPAPGIFDHAFEALTGRIEIERSATLMIGDSLSSDMAGGLAAGLATCWFNPNGTIVDPMPAIDHEITELTQLLDL